MGMGSLAFVPLLMFVAWLGLVVYAVSLARRLVFATEKIAAALDRSTADAPPR